MKRKTIRKEVGYSGIGLHKGQNIELKLYPRREGGIVFKRVDMEEKKNEIFLSVDNTFDLTRGTNLRNQYGAEIYTIEHFLSALYILGVTDLTVEVSGNELPICEGDSLRFVELLESAGLEELEEESEVLEIKKPINLTVADKHIIGLPYDGYKITYVIDFNHSFLKTQTYEIELNVESYKKEIARARTFCFDYEIEYLQKNSLALGGSLENAIVIKKDGVLNQDGLRFENEFVRHKILDLIGDLKVSNKQIKGHIIAIKAGHALNIEFLKKLEN